MSGPAALVDTNVLVSARNPHEAGYGPCRRLLQRVERGELVALVSTVTLAELRAGIAAEQVPLVWRPLLAHLLSSPNFRICPVDTDVAEEAGVLRAGSRLGLADAMIVATAHLRGADYLVTQDRAMARVQSVVPVRTPEQSAGA